MREKTEMTRCTLVYFIYLFLSACPCWPFVKKQQCKIILMEICMRTFAPLSIILTPWNTILPAVHFHLTFRATEHRRVYMWMFSSFLVRGLISADKSKNVTSGANNTHKKNPPWICPPPSTGTTTGTWKTTTTGATGTHQLIDGKD